MTASQTKRLESRVISYFKEVDTSKELKPQILRLGKRMGKSESTMWRWWVNWNAGRQVFRRSGPSADDNIPEHLRGLNVSQRIDLVLEVITTTIPTNPEGWKLDDIAEMACCSTSAVYQRQQKVIAKLRASFAEIGIHEYRDLLS